MDKQEVVLKRKIDMARRLGFWDDVEYWENELKKLQTK